MSLIQEALKRQQDEMTRQNAAQPNPPDHNPPPQGDEPEAPAVLSIKKSDAPPATPVQPPMATLPKKDEEVVITPLPAVPGPPVAAPEPSLAQPVKAQPKAAPPPALPKKSAAARKSQAKHNPEKAEKHGSKAPLMVVLILLVLILLGVGATLGARYLAARAETSLGSMVAELPAVLERALAGTNVSSTGDGANTDAPPPPPPPPGEASATEAAETEGANIGGTDLTEGIELPTGTETTDAAPKQWPRMKLTAIVGKGKNGAAILNGEVVATGDVIEQVTVIAIDNDGVELEFFGEKRFLRTGAHIE